MSKIPRRKKFKDIKVGETFRYNGRRVQRRPVRRGGFLWTKRYNCVDIDTQEELFIDLMDLLLCMMIYEDWNWVDHYLEPLPLSDEAPVEAVSEYDVVTNTQPYAEDLGVDEAISEVLSNHCNEVADIVARSAEVVTEPTRYEPNFDSGYSSCDSGSYDGGGDCSCD